MSENVPELRFLGCSGEWEENLLGNVTDSFSGGTPSVGIAQYYNGNIPFIRSGEINSTFTELYITQEGLSNSSAKIVDKGTILYALYGATSGEVGISNINGAINQAILAIIPIENYECYFIAQWLRKEKEVIISTFLQGGQGNLSGNIVKSLEIKFPSLPEQTQIGTLFQTLDCLITKAQQKHEKLLSLKKAMLTKMFPQKGQTVPEVRFQGFEGEWERKELGEVCDSLQYGLNASGKMYDGKNKYLRITDIDDVNRTFLKDDLTSPDCNLEFAENYKLKCGDLLFARTGASVGKTYIYRESDGLVYFAGFLIRGRIKKDYNFDFIFQNTLTESYNKFIAYTSQRSGQPGVNATEYGEFILKVPSFHEQTLIGNFFRELDHQISLQSHEIQSLKNLKQALLSKMFVS